jgi:hypothetical protein
MGICTMSGEEWAQRIVEKELGCTVYINDDGSAPGMYDLRVGPKDAPELAIECIGAVDEAFAETWNIGPARGPLHLSLTGDWNVSITAMARIKAIKQRIEPLLRILESHGIDNLYVDYLLKRIDRAMFDEFESLGITHASCYRRQGTGEVHLMMLGTGGIVNSQGSAVPAWIGEFLRDSARQDVLLKLQRSGAKERHVFVLADLTGTPWPVESYLIGELDHIPEQSPDLPQPVTGVWIVSTMGQRGLRWDRGAWKLFDAHGEGIDS